MKYVENPEKQVVTTGKVNNTITTLTCVNIGRMIAGQVSEVITELSPIVIAFFLGFLLLPDQEALVYDYFC